MRLPIRLYGLGLGGLLGKRFLLLTHVGRRTGRRHQTVVEVIGYDRERNEFFVLCGWGPTADWYRNLQANGAVQVQVGRRRFDPLHRVLDVDEAASVLASYERRNRLLAPVVRAVLSRLVGWPYDGSEPARRRLVAERPVVAFRARG